MAKAKGDKKAITFAFAIKKKSQKAWFHFFFDLVDDLPLTFIIYGVEIII